MSNTETANKAIADLKKAIEQGDKRKIIYAYEIVEHDQSFSWDNVDTHLGDEWDKLVDEGNDILYN